MSTDPRAQVRGPSAPSQELPDRLRRYFWEYGTSRLTLEENRCTIVRRLLDAGGWDAVSWLLREIGDDELRTLIMRREGRGLTAKRLRFWALVLGLPTEDVSGWIDSQKRNPWSRRTAS